MVTRIEIPTHAQIRAETWPCEGQIKATVAQLGKKSDVVFISRTGSGKTLTFWMPMIYKKESIAILVTDLNILGQQTTETLCHAGIATINLTPANANNETFKLWNYSKFSNHLAWVIFDEGHCVSQWGGTFHPEYASLFQLRFQLAKGVQFYAASATLPKDVLEDVYEKLCLK
ncbi:hypothetical protein K439DRAFT_1369012 [Ramaria rubella]|nr:hypothetical protein K439DRAFT_1369012 [Ramaria rubella]